MRIKDILCITPECDDPTFLLLSSISDWGRRCPTLALLCEESMELVWGLGTDVHFEPAQPFSCPCYLLGLPCVWFQERCRCLSQVCPIVGIHAFRLKEWPRNSTWRQYEWNGWDIWARALTCMYMRYLWCPIDRAVSTRSRVQVIGRSYSAVEFWGIPESRWKICKGKWVKITSLMVCFHDL